MGLKPPIFVSTARPHAGVRGDCLGRRSADIFGLPRGTTPGLDLKERSRAPESLPKVQALTRDTVRRFEQLPNAQEVTLNSAPRLQQPPKAQAVTPDSTPRPGQIPKAVAVTPGSNRRLEQLSTAQAVTPDSTPRPGQIPKAVAVTPGSNRRLEQPSTAQAVTPDSTPRAGQIPKAVAVTPGFSPGQAARLYSSEPGFSPARQLLFVLALLLPLLGACKSDTADRPPVIDSGPDRLANFAHLDHLSEAIEADEPVRIIHIYAEAPDYHWVGDDDEGIACVDDAARAAVVYLRDFELNGNDEHRQAGEALLRFILKMQAESGLFYNFVWDNKLTINETFRTSRADAVDWWTARAVWALAVGARTLRTANPELAAQAREAISKTFPHLEELLSRYGETVEINGRVVPQWLLHETAADATSELLLGLNTLNQTHPDSSLADMIGKFTDGIARMQWGTMNTFPWGAHASWIDAWHGWGNGQTQALAQIGSLKTPVHEAENFYPRLLIEGWVHSFQLDDPDSIREFEQIAYATRAVAVGLIRLHEATGDERYAIMAGLAASWFTGNNVTGTPMYDPATGRGYDGINNATQVNRNAGAESTIEALFTMVEIDAVPAARQWAYAAGAPPQRSTSGDKDYLYRVFATTSDTSTSRVGLIMNLTDEKLEVLLDADLERFLTGQE